MAHHRSVPCLIGGALGDAVGYPVEFVESGREIMTRFGASAPARLPRCDDGLVHVSDDTQMTLFTCEGIARSRRDGLPLIAAVHAAYQRWLWTQMPRRFDRPDGGGLIDVADMVARRAPGNTCLSALMDNVQEGRTPTVTAPPNQSKGCGAVMRSAPFGLAATNRDEAFAWARDAGALTHGHPSGYLSAGYLASLVFDLAEGSSLDEAMTRADALLVREPGHEETREALRVARALEPHPSWAVIEALPNGGWVGEWALAIAIACVRGVDANDEQKAADAIWRAAAHGGDSDSTATLAGSLLGAMGATFPTAWIAELEMREVIEATARALEAVTS